MQDPEQQEGGQSRTQKKASTGNAPLLHQGMKQKQALFEKGMYFHACVHTHTRVLCTCVCHMRMGTHRVQKTTEAGVAGSYKLPKVGAGNQNSGPTEEQPSVLQPLIHLSGRKNKFLKEAISFIMTMREQYVG